MEIQKEKKKKVTGEVIRKLEEKKDKILKDININKKTKRKVKK